ncbi:MAG: ThiF family adenylyltransferase [Planctomycetota bacterium]|jgi:molybdopterin/thiamine biosynthesis adenylyltransferase|nr:ThiF family adenylyltransferase [Planctomycetota bacterium]
MCCGFQDDPQAGTGIISQLSSIGVSVIGSDYAGKSGAQHWYPGRYDHLVEKLSVNAEFVHLDPGFLAGDIQLATAAATTNAWTIVALNDPKKARATLHALAQSSVSCQVLLAMSAPSGVLVHRCQSVRAALSATEALPMTMTVPPGPPEHAVILGGVATNEVLRVGQDDDHSPGTVAFYSLASPARITVQESEGLAELFNELSTSSAPDGTASLEGMSMVIVGAGALSNWAVIPLVLGGVNHIVVLDGDESIDESNISRQPLLVDDVGPNPKVDALVRQLKLLNPSGHYEGICRFVHKPEDIEQLASFAALISAPDNDAARCVCDTAAAEAGVPLAVAGSSAEGATVIVRGGGRPCLPCLGISSTSAPASCATVAEDAIVSTNAVAAGLLVSELRQTLSNPTAAPLQHFRFNGRARSGNRFEHGMTKVRCKHRAAAVNPSLAERS